MLTKKEKATLAPPPRARDPFSMLRQMTTEFGRMFDEPNWPFIRAWGEGEPSRWIPRIEVAEKENRLVTRVELPGLKKEDVKVEVVDGQLAISGERKREVEEKTEQLYRSEREYGTFYRAVPLPEGAAVDDIKATFTNGVLEVAVPMPARVEEKPRLVEIAG
jgi:HSP20 family protein